jgi:hypothetical protein
MARRPSGVVLQRAAAKLSQPGEVERALAEIAVLLRHEASIARTGDGRRKALGRANKALVDLHSIQTSAERSTETREHIKLLKEYKRLQENTDSRRASMAPPISYKRDSAVTAH